jgi:hypothetical protein
MWFKQKCAAARKVKESMEVFREIFPDHVIELWGGLTWPEVRCDLSACTYFLWGYLKEKSKTTTTQKIEDLKLVTRKRISAVPRSIAR